MNIPAPLRILIVIAAFAALWVRRRNRSAAQREAAFRARYARNADGIILGAEPILLRGTRPGALLLLHGYNDSPQSMRAIAERLHARGWTVSVPLLAGHGRSLEAFAASGADQWLRDANAALTDLFATHDTVAVGGLSMGGALALRLAAYDPRVRAVIVFAPYLHTSWAHRLLDVAAPVAAVVTRYLEGGGARSVHDIEASEAMIAYRASTPRLLVQLARVVRQARAGLGRVKQPVLMIQSREDNRIPPASAEETFARIGSADKTLHWTSGNGHVVTVDYGFDAIAELAGDWLESRIESRR